MTNLKIVAKTETVNKSAFISHAQITELKTQWQNIGKQAGEYDYDLSSKIGAEISAASTAYLDSLVHVRIDNDLKLNRCEPDEIVIGDLIGAGIGGFIGRVVEAKVHKRENEHPVFVFLCEYVSGDLWGYKILSSGGVCNGTEKGQLAHIQGNKRARWEKV